MEGDYEDGEDNDKKSDQGGEISDAVVFAALDALVEQDEENRWWAGL